MLHSDRLEQVSSTDYSQVFSAQGVIGPFRVLTAAECTLIEAYVANGELNEPDTWFKGYACSDRLVYAIATRKNILDIVERLIGSDLYLWGTSIVVKGAGESHHWHTDIETSDPNGTFVSVWIGISNTSYKSGLQFVEQSHLLGRTLQEVAANEGVSRIERTAEISLSLAKRHRTSCSLSKKSISDGEAFFFDGRTWHGSLNEGDRPRKAILLQYATNASAVRIPDFDHLEYPFKYTSKYAPGLIVRGKPLGVGNKRTPLQSFDKNLSHPLVFHIDSGSSKQPWTPFHLFHGRTSCLELLNAHFSVLQPGHCPHPPHKHIEEELLTVLDGVAKITVGEDLTQQLS